MAQEIEKQLKYSPKVTVWVDKKIPHGYNIQEDIQIPVPDGQEWLYAVLERQGKNLNAIKGILIFFTILTILSIIFTIWQAFALRQALGL